MFASFKTITNNLLTYMIRQEKLKGSLTVNIDGFKATVKLRTRTYKTGNSTIKDKSGKTNRIIRCAAIADHMPTAFIRMAEQSRKNGKSAKRNAKKYAKRK